MELYDELQTTRSNIKALVTAANDLAMAYRDLPEDACQQRRIMHHLHNALQCQLYITKRREADICRELGV